MKKEELIGIDGLIYGSLIISLIKNKQNMTTERQKIVRKHIKYKVHKYYQEEMKYPLERITREEQDIVNTTVEDIISKLQK
jgi:hypothetical protein